MGHRILSEIKLADQLPDYLADAVRKIEKETETRLLDLEIPDDRTGIPDIMARVSDSESNRMKEIIANVFRSKMVGQFRYTKLAIRLSESDNAIASLLKESAGIGELSTIKDIAKLYTKEFRVLDTRGGLDTKNPSFRSDKTNIRKFMKGLQSHREEMPQSEKSMLDSLVSALDSKEFGGMRNSIVRAAQNTNTVVSGEIYLKVTSKADDMLRSSVSDFYTSCLNIYTGGAKIQAVANALDGGSKAAYIISNSEYTDNRGNKHPFTPLARTILRVREDGKAIIERTYPETMEGIMGRLIRESGIEYLVGSYTYKSDPQTEKAGGLYSDRHMVIPKPKDHMGVIKDPDRFTQYASNWLNADRARIYGKKIAVGIKDSDGGEYRVGQAVFMLTPKSVTSALKEGGTKDFLRKFDIFQKIPITINPTLRAMQVKYNANRIGDIIKGAVKGGESEALANALAALSAYSMRDFTKIAKGVYPYDDESSIAIYKKWA